MQKQRKRRVFQILVLMQVQVASWVGMSTIACWEIAK